MTLKCIQFDGTTAREFPEVDSIEHASLIVGTTRSDPRIRRWVLGDQAGKVLMSWARRDGYSVGIEIRHTLPSMSSKTGVDSQAEKHLPTWAWAICGIALFITGFVLLRGWAIVITLVIAGLAFWRRRSQNVIVPKS